MFQIKFLGVGSAFTLPASGNVNHCDWQSNVLVIAENGKKLLIDCGSDVRFSLQQQGLSYGDIDGVYISHLHADHVCGLEWLAFTTYFDPKCTRPKMFCSATIAGPLWTQSLRGGLESIEGRKMDLTGYFNLRKIPKNGHFVWEDVRFDLVQVVHVMSERSIKHSYGLMIYENGGSGAKIFFTTDTQFCPNQIKRFYEDADLILHDCETAPFAFKSGVHAHYDELTKLDPKFRGKMWLYHYQPGAPEKRNPVVDGFAGFVRKGNVFTVKDKLITAPEVIHVPSGEPHNA